MTLSLPVIHKDCKAPMRVEIKSYSWVQLKYWVCTRCKKRMQLDNLNAEVINNLIMV